MCGYKTRQLHRSTIRAHIGTQVNVPKETIYEDENIALSPAALTHDNPDDRKHSGSDIRNFTSQKDRKTKSNIKVFFVSIQNKRPVA